MRILLTSDWHLDWVTHGVSRFEDLERAVEATVRHAVDTRCDAYGFCGDLCDPDSGSRVFRCAALAIDAALDLSDAEIPSFWLAGNHDVIEDGTGGTTLAPLAALGSREIVVCEQPDVATVGGLVVALLPFTASSHAYDAEECVRNLDNHQHVHMVVGHLSVPGVVPGEETADMPRGRDVVLPVDEIKRRLPRARIVQGHYHRRQVTKDGVIIVGSLARLTFNEEGNDPGFLVLEV